MRDCDYHQSKKDRGDYEEFEKKRKRKRRDDQARGQSILEVKTPHLVTTEVIEVHGSSSEAEESSAGTDKHIKHKRSHSHRHRKHRKHDSGNNRSSDSKVDSSENDRSFKRQEEKRRESTVDHKQRHRRQRRDEREEADYREERERKHGVLLENVRVKEDKTGDYHNEDNRKDRVRHKAKSRDEGERGRERVKKEERDRSRSPTRVKEEMSGTSGSRRNNSHDGRESQRPQQEVKQRSSERREQATRHNERNKRRRDEDDSNYEWGQSGPSTITEAAAIKAEPTDKEGPDFKLSGKLTEDRNTFNGVVIKYSEPPESRMPKKRWRLYQFKGQETLPTLYIHRQSAYLIGRDRKVVDLPVDHPSCSKQHAALQYRLVTYERANGTIGKQIRLYVIDLESANGTFINGSKIESKKYVELIEKDVVKFGFSSREYVLLHEHSKDDERSSDDE